jgi:hypothetical protein
MTSDYIRVFILSLLKIPGRLQNVVVNYLMMLMLDSARHSMTNAAELSGLSVSQFSRLLINHRDLAKSSLEALSVAAGQSAGKGIEPLCPKSPWKIAIIVDASIHLRSSVHIENSQRFNHGQGFKVGHQWTNILLVINGRDIPLPPIKFLTRKECERRKVPYLTEIDRVIERIETLELSKYVGQHYPEDIVVLMDGGYDAKKIQNSILQRGWDFIISLKSSRSVKSSSSNRKSWQSVADIFWSTRKQSPWKTVRFKRDGKRQRKGIRARKLTGYLKGVKGREMALVCSEKSKGIGRRFLACSRAIVCTSMVIQLYKVRWRVEIFHRDIKGLFGLEDIAGKAFDAVEAHVHWVYSTYILMSILEIDGGLTARRSAVSKAIRLDPSRALSRKIQLLQGQFGGREKIRDLVAAVVLGKVAA